MKVVACLGNPGAEYSMTRHNVGWWLAERLAEVWALGRFRRQGNAAVAGGRVDGVPVEVVKPLTYMNRSGVVLAPLRHMEGFELSRDLLVVVDDVALEPGRARLRMEGSPGGHNGLKSIEASLGTRDYPRLRIGVGAAPPGADLAEWVLSSPPRPDRQAIQDLFPDLIDGMTYWLQEDLERAVQRCNAAGRDAGPAE